VLTYLEINFFELIFFFFFFFAYCFSLPPPLCLLFFTSSSLPPPLHRFTLLCLALFHLLHLHPPSPSLALLHPSPLLRPSFTPPSPLLHLHPPSPSLALLHPSPLLHPSFTPSSPFLHPSFTPPSPLLRLHLFTYLQMVQECHFTYPSHKKKGES
jgi:hypothetical protein